MAGRAADERGAPTRAKFLREGHCRARKGRCHTWRTCPCGTKRCCGRAAAACCAPIRVPQAMRGRATAERGAPARVPATTGRAAAVRGTPN
eukprot:3482656-Alexandrium_andersonii.AAC.1